MADHSEDHCSDNSYENVIIFFLSVDHAYQLLFLWKMKMKQTERKAKSIIKREAAGIFMVGMMVSREIYDKVLYLIHDTWRKTFHMPK